MDVGGAVGALNWLAVLGAAGVPFLLGALWYGPLFGRTWMTASGVTEEMAANQKMGRTFGLAFVLQFVQAAVLGMFIGADAGLAFGLLAGLFAGTAWVATALGVLYLFEQRSMAHFLVNAGYMAVSFTIMGIILGAWA